MDLFFIAPQFRENYGKLPPPCIFPSPYKEAQEITHENRKYTFQAGL